MSDYIPDQNRFLNSWLFEEFDLDDIIILHLLNLLPKRWEHNHIDWNYHVNKKKHEKNYVYFYEQ